MSSHSFNPSTPFASAGQQPHRYLTITIPDESRLDVDLHTPFRGSSLLRRSFSQSIRGSTRRSTTSSLVGSPLFASAFYDSDSFDEDSVEWDNEDHAQYLIIPSHSPFFTPPQPSDSLPYVLGQSSQLAFSCDSLNDGDSDIDRAAQIFHDELARMAPGLEDRKIDPGCLKEMGAELVVSPLRLFEEYFYDSLSGQDPVSSAVVATTENPAEEETDSEDDDDDGELYCTGSEEGISDDEVRVSQSTQHSGCGISNSLPPGPGTSTFPTGTASTSV
ncbi:hypothetical protein PQX77_020360 [Marasmius sp. AFHP31]|nr:hypothetical protein PQX77_020360 [Marasmius sp. AFHP31]